MTRKAERFSVTSCSEAATERVGRALGGLMRAGDIVGLVGELGSGKTRIVRGLAQGLEVDPQAWVNSPTFTLLNAYDGRLPLYHFDLYRLNAVEELEEIGFYEMTAASTQGAVKSGVVVIEWADKFDLRFPTDLFWVKMGFAGDAARTIDFMRGPYAERDPNWRKTVTSLVETSNP